MTFLIDTREIRPKHHDNRDREFAHVVVIIMQYLWGYAPSQGIFGEGWEAKTFRQFWG